MKKLDNLNIGLAVILGLALLALSVKGAESVKLEVDCQKQNLSECVLYAIPLREGK